MAMLADLRFADERLEGRFERELSVSRLSVVSGFSKLRVCVLTAFTLR
jgi:hypothetical protein